MASHQLNMCTLHQYKASLYKQGLISWSFLLPYSEYLRNVMYWLNCTTVFTANEVPGSAVLVFDIELVDFEEGLPEGYMFIWNDEVSTDLFSEMDTDKNAQVEASEVRFNKSLKTTKACKLSLHI